MIELAVSDRKHIAPMFAGIDETLICSCLQGHMGRAWADRVPDPAVACIITGDFCYLAGDARDPQARDMVAALPRLCRGGVMIITPPDGRWMALCERLHPGRTVRGERYATHKEPGAFDRARLLALRARLPDGYALRPIDAELCAQTADLAWARDFCSQFADAADYLRRGLGWAAVRGGKLCGGASSYTVFDGGIEVEVATAPAHRRRGLAAACCAALLLACMDRGLYPSWDAANKHSLALAGKLGYRFSHAYAILFLNAR